MSANDYNKMKALVQEVLHNADNSSDPSIKSNLAVLACILTSGMIEAAARHFLSLYAHRRSSPTVHQFVVSKLRRSTNNLKTEDLLVLVGSFDPELRKKIESKLDDEAKDSIDSVVDRRNKLAHGNVSGIGLDTMKRYFASISLAMDMVGAELSL